MNKNNLGVSVPNDFKMALKLKPKALDIWKDLTPIARRDWILWIITAKLKETRSRRIDVACSKLSSGIRRVCCFGGISWLIKNSHTMDKKVAKIVLKFRK
jgi:hypothetical protein